MVRTAIACFVASAAANELSMHQQSSDALALLSQMSSPFIADEPMSVHGCKCRAQMPDFPAPCLDGMTPGFAWAVEFAIPRPFCAVDFTHDSCTYPEAQPDAKPDGGKSVLKTCSPEAAFRWWAAGGGLVECARGEKSVLGPIGAAGMSCTDVREQQKAKLAVPAPPTAPKSIDKDECTARGAGTPFETCSKFGQICKDTTPMVQNDWHCECTEGKYSLKTTPQGAALCAVDECDSVGEVCTKAGQLCIDANHGSAHTGDWSCNCDTNKMLVGTKRGAIAECHRLISVMTTINNDVPSAVATSAEFVSGFEAAMKAMSGFESTVVDIKQRQGGIWHDAHSRGSADFSDATRIEAVVIAAPDVDTEAVRSKAVLPRMAINALLGSPSIRVSASGSAKDVVECGADEMVRNNKCIRCPHGGRSAAGNRADAEDTHCTSTHCTSNEHVFNHVCVPCEDGLWNHPGDSAMGGNTECKSVHQTAKPTPQPTQPQTPLPTPGVTPLPTTKATEQVREVPRVVPQPEKPLSLEEHHDTVLEDVRRAITNNARNAETESNTAEGEFTFAGSISDFGGTNSATFLAECTTVLNGQGVCTQSVDATGGHLGAITFKVTVQSANVTTLVLAMNELAKCNVLPSFGFHLYPPSLGFMCAQGGSPPPNSNPLTSTIEIEGCIEDFGGPNNAAFLDECSEYFTNITGQNITCLSAVAGACSQCPNGCGTVQVNQSQLIGGGERRAEILSNPFPNSQGTVMLTILVPAGFDPQSIMTMIQTQLANCASLPGGNFPALYTPAAASICGPGSQWGHAYSVGSPPPPVTPSPPGHPSASPSTLTPSNNAFMITMAGCISQFGGPNNPAFLAACTQMLSTQVGSPISCVASMAGNNANCPGGGGTGGRHAELLSVTVDIFPNPNGTILVTIIGNNMTALNAALSDLNQCNAIPGFPALFPPSLSFSCGPDSPWGQAYAVGSPPPPVVFNGLGERHAQPLTDNMLGESAKTEFSNNGNTVGDRCSSLIMPQQCRGEGQLTCVNAFVEAGCVEPPQQVPAECKATDPTCVSTACSQVAECMQWSECQWKPQQGCVAVAKPLPAVVPRLTADIIVPIKEQPKEQLNLVSEEVQKESAAEVNPATSSTVTAAGSRVHVAATVSKPEMTKLHPDGLKLPRDLAHSPLVKGCIAVFAFVLFATTFLLMIERAILACRKGSDKEALLPSEEVIEGDEIEAYENGYWAPVKGEPNTLIRQPMPMPLATDGELYPIGTVVRVHGIKSMPHVNGKIGTVKRHRCTKDGSKAMTVILECGEYHLKRSNVVPALPEQRSVRK